MSRRNRIGIAAALILVVSGILYVAVPGGESAAFMLFRVGLVLGAIWLAWTDLARVPRWLSVGAILSLFVAGRYPMLALIIIPAVWLAKYAWTASDGKS